jgi:hypothetical protein
MPLPHATPHRMPATQCYRDSRGHWRTGSRGRVHEVLRGCGSVKLRRNRVHHSCRLVDRQRRTDCCTQPDLVIASVPYQEKAVIEILKSGARFLGLRAEESCRYLRRHRDHRGRSRRQRSRRSGDHPHAAANRTRFAFARWGLRPKVFCEEWGKPLISSQPWVAELVEAAGGEFLGGPGQQISAEEVARMDPDILIAAWCGAGDRVPLDKILADRGWQGTRAARASRVYCIRDEYLNTPAPTLFMGWMPWPLPFIPNSLTARKESARLPAFRLPQP